MLTMIMGNKKSCLFIMIFLVIALALGAGCTAQNAVVKDDGGVLTVGLDKTVDTMDILKAGDPLVWFPGHQINETLVFPGDDMKPGPLLAESWERVDGTTWKFNLRKGVTFHDGTPFNAEAVKYSLERMMKEGPKWALPPIKSVEAVDENTVLLKTEKPFSPLLDYLMNPIAAMFSPAAGEKQKGDFSTNPIGTGPFKLEKFVPEQQVDLVRNDNYWSDRPKLKKVVFKIVIDPSTRVMALRSGDVDVIRNFPTAEVAMMEKDGQYNVLKVVGVRTHYFGFNMQRDYFGDLKVRQAFNHAINKEAIISHVMHGMGEQAYSFVAPKMPEHIDVPGYAYDPDKAGQLLAEAGWKDTDADGILDKGGKPFKIKLVMQTWSVFWKPSAEALQSQLKDIGVELSINVMERGALTEVQKKRDFDLNMSCTPAASGGADYQLSSRFQSTFNPETMASAGYVNERVNSLLDLAKQEMDGAKRMQMYQEVQKIVNDEAVAIPYVYDMEFVAANKRINGFKPHPAVWAINLKNVEI
jgi:peptide/nickel transport system substrate-binding protein